MPLTAEHLTAINAAVEKFRKDNPDAYKIDSDDLMVIAMIESEGFWGRLAANVRRERNEAYRKLSLVQEERDRFEALYNERSNVNAELKRRVDALHVIVDHLRSLVPACGVLRSPLSTDVCTLPAGHEGNHMCCYSDGTPMGVWDRFEPSLPILCRSLTFSVAGRPGRLQCNQMEGHEGSHTSFDDCGNRVVWG